MSKMLKSGERISEEFDYNSYIEQKSTYTFEVSKILEYSSDFKDKTLIDCASGEGYGSDLIKRKISDLDVYGVDIDSLTIDHSSQKYKNIFFSTGSILDLENIFKNKFDFFISNQTFEHLSSLDQKKALGTVYKLLNKNGLFAIAVPNKPVYEIYSPNNPYHLNELDIINFKELLETQNWSKIQIYGQELPNYQKTSMFRKSRGLAYLLNFIPKPMIRILQRLLVPKITQEDVVVEIFDESKLKNYKILIALCYK